MHNCARQASQEIFRTWLVLYAAPHPPPVDEYSAASGNNRRPAHHDRAAVTRAAGANDTPGAYDRIGVGRLGKVDTGFPSRQTRNAFARRSCSSIKIERDDDSKKSHRALGPLIPQQRTCGDCGGMSVKCQRTTSDAWRRGKAIAI